MEKTGFITLDNLIAEWSLDPFFSAQMDAARERRKSRQATGDIIDASGGFAGVED